MPVFRSVLIAACLLITLPAYAQDGYRTPPEALAKLVDAPPTPGVSLSPDGTTMLVLDRQALPSIEQVAQPELRLAGLRMNPRTNGASRDFGGYTGLLLRGLDGSNERPITGVPADAHISDVDWAPDGRHLAFTVTTRDRIDLYVADVATGQARRVLEAAVNDVYYGTPYAWLSDGQTLLVRTVPEGRGEPPVAPLAPTGPVVQENLGKTAPARTYQDLLQNPQDEALFRYYMTTQLVLAGLDGTTTAIGEPALIADAAPSPDGRYLLTQTIHEPFSYLVPAYRFPTRIEVVDRDGTVVREIADLPLAEEVPTGFGSVPTGVRSVAWRADAPAALTWTEARDGGDARADVDVRDEVFMLEAPFEGEATSLIELPLRYDGIRWTADGRALVSEDWFTTRQERVYVVDVADGEAPRLWIDRQSEDRYSDPGNPVMEMTERGTWVVQTTPDGAAAFMIGDGASPEGDRPFLRTMDLQTGSTTELFRSEAPYYEEPVTVLDDTGERIMTRRESSAAPPNYFVRDLAADELMAVTDFPHPYPEYSDIQKEFVTYERADGVQLTATLYLPPDYDAEQDGPLPTFVWAYPREYKSAAAAGQIDDSPYRFKRVSYWGAVPYVVQGYAVLDGASMPIIGEGDEEPNDSFRDQLVMNADAVIAEGVRRGVVDPDRVAIGGHSYGAFMTANLLAHSDLFRAGIARSGAYNRTLTPFGFQREERTYWEAPEIYYGMSPFMHADDINEPVLLIHGAADNNSGTYPMQSERYYSALKGLGKTARLVMLPHESHGYRARESLLHMLWEMDTWLDTYVKNAPQRVDVEETSGD